MTQSRRILWFSFCTAALLLLPNRVTAQSAPATDDATIQLKYPTTNDGSGSNLGVQGPNLQEAYIRFDLSVLPSGLQASNINKATLRLFLANVSVGGTFDIRLVSGIWSETTLTYNNAPPAGLLIAGSVPVNTSEGRDFVLVDVSSAVQAWLSGTANNGIVLTASPGSLISANFDSKESSSTSHDPEIEIEVVSVGPRGAQGPMGPAGTAATVTVGQTTTGPNALVTNAGTSSAALLNFVIPQGLTGPPGPVLPDLVYTDKDNKFTSNQIMQGNVALAPTGSATTAQGYPSNPLDLAASVSDGANVRNETFRWQSVPVNNGGANFGAQLSLLYGGGVTPSPTGFSANADGTLNFVSNQAFTGKHVGDGSGLTNLPSTFTAGGDLTGTATSQTVVNLLGAPVLRNNQNKANGSVISLFNGIWTPVPGFSPGGDLSGTATSQTVVNLLGAPVLRNNQNFANGSVISLFNGIWTPVPGFSPGGDLSGTATSQTVVNLLGAPVLRNNQNFANGSVISLFNGIWTPVPMPAGPVGPVGPVGITNRGPWSSATAYNMNEAVTNLSSYWLALKQNTNSEPSLTNTANWQLLAGGIVNQGVWSASNSYNVNDVVFDSPSGSSWLAVAPTSANTATPNTSCEPGFPPSPCAADWQLLATQGAPGAAGNAATIQVGQATTGPVAVTNTGSPSAAILNFSIPQGPMGPAGPQGPAGPAGAAGAGAGGLHGMQEFTSSGTFTVPPDTTSIMVQMWGADGGFPNYSPSCPPSCSATVADAEGGPGSGAYSAGVFSVTPGTQYTVTVGQSGSGGTSQIVAPDGTVVVYANGGQVGTPDPRTPNVSPECTVTAGTNATTAALPLSGGAGGAANPNAPVSRAGNAGTSGSSCFIYSTSEPYDCGTFLSPATCYTTQYFRGSGGNGAEGAAVGGLINAPSGTGTKQGYILIIW